MSNVIKAYTVRYDDEVKKTIDTHLRMQKELEAKRNTVLRTVINQPEGFVEGLQAMVVESLPTSEEIQEQNTRTIEEAQKEAAAILDQAKREAERIKNDAYTSAQKKGYEDGMLQAKKEGQKLKAEYEWKEQQLQEQLDAMVEDLEPQMVKLISELILKITGVVVQDKEEVILYLIERAIKNIDKSNEYNIKVSKEDYDYVFERKNQILEAIGREVTIYISEDAGLCINQCLIETELKVINCSLDVQLTNLITNLKLIGDIQ